MDLRCEYKKHGELVVSEGLLEIKCNSRLCGAGDGVVIIHVFDVLTGKLFKTHRFQEPRLNIERSK